MSWRGGHPGEIIRYLSCAEWPASVGGKGSRTTERADRKKLIADTPKEGGAKRCGGVSAGVPDLVERVLRGASISRK